MPSAPARTCAWCYGPIGRGQRSDAVYCRTLCRQSAHRFKAGMHRRASTGVSMRFAYADPPYPGKAKIYRGHPDYRGEVDHGALVARLVDGYPDGWALSTSAHALPAVLELCPPGVRVAAWFRGERPGAHVRPLSSWEPVVYSGGREILTSPHEHRRVDGLVHICRPRGSDPNRVKGAKPADFAWWLFELLGALPHDRLDDLFPGSGGIARAWSIYQTEGDIRPKTLRPDVTSDPSLVATAAG